MSNTEPLESLWHSACDGIWKAQVATSKVGWGLLAEAAELLLLLASLQPRASADRAETRKVE